MQAAIATIEQAIQYTLDDNLKKILQGCIKKKWPPQFKITNGKIITTKGNTYPVPQEPMAACNLIHDIINGQEIHVFPVKSYPSNTRGTSISNSSRSSRIPGISGISDDSIYSFVKRETKRLKRDEYYMETLLSCIYSSIMINYITDKDFIFKDGKIASIKGIDTSGPFILERK